jgi:hypothetical protein
MTAIFTGGAGAQSGVIPPPPPAQHISFDRPEAWALKRFDVATLPSTMLPVAPPELRKVGKVTVGLTADWLPMLDAGQQTVGFNGTEPEDLNKAPVLIRPVIAVQLPSKFRVFATAPIPISTFGIKPRLFAFGVDRPLLERGQWTLHWQAYGQVGSVKGSFTCRRPGFPSICVGTSSDIASLHYAGVQFQMEHPLPQLPKLVLHASVAGTFADLAFLAHAPLVMGLEGQGHYWTRGGIFSTTGGATYLFNHGIALTVDAFYAPLQVNRTQGAPLTNDGLFNVRSLLSYNFSFRNRTTPRQP